ncbi:hypothetical protein M1328_02420 [Patescibacteria group bacterium]|nr:hypothetical protein [Patescibacteria group bacterium]
MTNLNTFKIKNIYQEDKNDFRALYSSKDDLLRVEVKSNIDQATADQYITANIAQIKGLFTDALAPYPGVVSDTVSCGQKYQPTFGQTTNKDGLEINYLIAYLNTNLTYGSCNDAQIVYKGFAAYFYCPKNKQAFHLELIVPRKTFESSPKTYEDLLKTIKCN